MEHIIIPATKKLTFLYDQRIDTEDVLNLTFELHQSSTLNAQFIFADRTSSKCSIKIIMLGQRAQATINGAYFLNGEQKFELNVMQEHLGKDSESHVICKGVLAGSAFAKYEGVITIAANAPHSVASQENKNILLSGKARAVSVPNLQALNNEVQCSHGSAVGQLDADQLWYMQTRAISMARAQHLLLEGFFMDTVSPDVDLGRLLERVV